VKPRQAYKPRTKGVPVRNKDTGRAVYVLRETLEKDHEKFQPLREDEVGDPRWRGKSKPPRRPRKPEKPEVPRESPPAPIHPQIPKKVKRQTEQVTEVPDVKPMKIPEPSPQRRWKRLKKYTPITASAESVLRRYLEALEGEP